MLRPPMMITSFRGRRPPHAVGEVAVVAGVQPAVDALGRHRAVDRQVPAVTDSPRSCSTPTPRSPSTSRRRRRRPGSPCPASGGPSSGKRRARRAVHRAGPATCGPLLERDGVDLVDLQPGVDRRERHPQRRLGHPVGADHGLGAQAEARAGRGERGTASGSTGSAPLRANRSVDRSSGPSARPAGGRGRRRRSSVRRSRCRRGGRSARPQQRRGAGSRSGSR